MDQKTSEVRTGSENKMPHLLKLFRTKTISDTHILGYSDICIQFFILENRVGKQNHFVFGEHTLYK